MITKVDAGARLSNSPDILEDHLKRLRGHQVGNESCDASAGRCGGLLGGIAGDARTRNILAVPKMQVGIDNTRKHRQPGDVDPLMAANGATRR